MQMLLCGWNTDPSTIKQPPLHVPRHLGFVIIRNQEVDEFDKFKHKEVSLGLSILKCNDLLNLWLTKQENIYPYTQYDAQYVCLQSTQIDELCE